MMSELDAFKEMDHKLNRLAAMADSDNLRHHFAVWFLEEMRHLITWREALDLCERRLLQGLPLPWLEEETDDPE
jgi:hypothetical protein